MKTLIIIVVTAVVVGGGVAGVFYKMRSSENAGDATIVRVEPAARGDLVETVSAAGQVRPKTKVSISARVAARIIDLPFKEGDVVTKGNPTSKPAVEPSVLVRLDAKDLDAQLRAAQAHYEAQSSALVVAEARIRALESQIEASKVMLADAERDFKRQKELFATKDVSQSAVDSAQTKFDQLKAQLVSSERTIDADRSNLQVLKHELEAADAEIARARDSLSYTTITSPVDGVVTRVNSEVGELVVIGTMNNPGTVIMEVADLTTMLVNARVDEASITSLKVGQKVKVNSQAYSKETFDGVVSAVALAETEEKDGTKFYKCEVTLNTNGRRILSGLTADVDIETARHEKVITVPSQAVLGRPVDELPVDMRNKPEVDKNKTLATVVYRMVDGKAMITPVRVGASDVAHTIIESGLTEGDQIIVGPYKVLEKLAHDQKVKDEKTASTEPTSKPA